MLFLLLQRKRRLCCNFLNLGHAVCHILFLNFIFLYLNVAYEAFPLLHNLMWPYPGRTTGLLPLDKKVFKYRYFIYCDMMCFFIYFEWVIQAVEGSTLVARWQLLKYEIYSKPANFENYTKACCLHFISLHNYLQSDEKFDPNELNFNTEKDLL